MLNKPEKMKVEQVRFPSYGSFLMLEGEYTASVGEPPFYGAILCHPHPLYGGNMHNILILKLREKLQETGISTIRFNFRGTGLSEGEHDYGNNEVLDISGASKYFTDRGVLSTRQIIIGYSFGAAMGLKFLENNPDYLCFVGIALPTSFKEYFHAGAVIHTPSLLISGDIDEISSLEEAVRLVEIKNPETYSVPGGNHLFTGTDPDKKQSRISHVTEKTIEFIRKNIQCESNKSNT
ncbi:MAG: hypothetical protein A2161_03030 [Candidatus Schekmanbacteria bacterium RBG_13_48_7]|uniref:Serine aminopeptidase S33 domain-containing protein n=1 Tax=Candidatus Schekmanbacteria bacterium RBG_13_48_7 TaxID=1817878 RepID=A0A1F7RXV2_9BACT|nr:MAG: hypothetical protein A2161_03030 [Candidatus Schekmanbacteria bacterium RBG_13_48_7]